MTQAATNVRYYQQSSVYIMLFKHYTYTSSVIYFQQSHANKALFYLKKIKKISEEDMLQLHINAVFSLHNF